MKKSEEKFHQDDKKHLIDIARLNYRQAVLVAIITIIPTILGTYFATRQKPDNENWKERYDLIESDYTHYKDSIRNKPTISDLSILLMDTPNNKYFSIKDGETNSHEIERIILQELNLKVKTEIYQVRQDDIGQIEQLDQIENKSPNLIIIHRSAFPEAAKEDDWLLSFINSAFQSSDNHKTRFLIYSRGFNDKSFISKITNPELREYVDINIWCFDENRRMRPFKNRNSRMIIGEEIMKSLKLILYELQS